MILICPPSVLLYYRNVIFILPDVDITSPNGWVNKKKNGESIDYQNYEHVPIGHHQFAIANF